MRKSIVAAILLVVGVGLVWGFTGGFDRVVEGRISTSLQKQGVPEPVADCMATTLVSELDYNQLRQLEKLRAEEGEADRPRNWREIRQRLARVDDPRVVAVAGRSAVTCTLGGFRGALPS